MNGLLYGVMSTYLEYSIFTNTVQLMMRQGAIKFYQGAVLYVQENVAIKTLGTIICRDGM